jgi:hypothetical protein
MANSTQDQQSSQPQEFPDPPLDWAEDQILTVLESGPWYRLNRVDPKYPSALYFDRSGKGRFDGTEQGYGMLYLGQDLHTCFAECFARDRLSAVTEIALRSRDLFEIRTTRPLTLVDLTGKGLVRIGADAVLTTGDYDKSRKWAKRIWESSEKFDGIRYRSRVDNDRYCYGLFDRTNAYLEEKNLGNLIDRHANKLAEILDDYSYALVSG